MQVIFFRHGIAEDRTGDQPDFDRALTDEGIEKTHEAARGLAKLIDKPQAILSSPKLRAVQTAQLIARAFDMKHQELDALAGGDIEAMIEALKKRKEQSVIAVGHEPDFSEAVEMLCFGQVWGRVQLKKAGAACVSTTGPLRVGGATLDWLATPRMLRGLAR